MNQNRVYQNSKDLLIELFNHGIANVQPKNILKNFLKVSGQKIEITENNNKKVYKKIKRIVPICVGKASVDMANTSKSILRDFQNEISEGIIVVNKENFKQVNGFKCFCSSHPIPDDSGLLASKFIEDKLQSLGENDLILFFLSGGGSALLPYPAGNINLEEKIEVNKFLINSGANIREINTVRKHLSKIKGGNLLKMTYPAKVHSFILSDVIGDDLSSISSGPTAPDETSFEDVKDILIKYNIWKKLPSSITSHINNGLENKNLETPDKTSNLFKTVNNTLIGSNYLCLRSIEKYCQAKNIESNLWKYNLEGDVNFIAKELVNSIKKIKISKPTIFISGGETTVKLKGSGIGGRNQELALHFIKYAESLFPNMKYSFLSIGTDGRDGPTDAAGAIVDNTSIEKIKNKEINLEKELNNNNSYEVLKKIDSLVIIEGTNTNVADLQLLMIN